MVSIYCLIDPRSNTPFYVGCTRSSLKNRLSGHITEIKTYTGNHRSKKQEFIATMINEQVRPEILLLCHVSLEYADHCEKFYYKILASLGFELLQLSTSFFYAKKMLAEEANYKEFMNKCTNVAKINP